MNLGLNRKHVVVTGASQGIGQSIAEEFAKEGAKVSLVARRADRLKEVIDGMQGGHDTHCAFGCDLMPKGAPESLLEKIVAQKGHIDILIHNLGGTLGSHNVLADSDEWMRILRFNAGIAMDLNRVMIPEMEKNRWGRIVHIISTSADDLSGAGPYAAAKSYLKAYTQIMGRKFAPSGIVISGVSPGAIGTHKNGWVKKQQERPEVVADFLQRHQAIGRLGSGTEITPFVLLLSSELATFACGSVLQIAGGLT